MAVSGRGECGGARTGGVRRFRAGYGTFCLRGWMVA